MSPTANAEANTLSIDPQRLQARLAHLQAVQTVIARMATYSATVKNFCLTVSAGLLAIAFQKQTAVLAPAAILFVTIFMCLDAYYLALERAFRDLYTEVCKRDLALALELAIKNRAIRPLDFLGAVASVSVWAFYIPVLIAIAALIYGGAHVASKP